MMHSIQQQNDFYHRADDLCIDSTLFKYPFSTQECMNIRSFTEFLVLQKENALQGKRVVQLEGYSF